MSHPRPPSSPFPSTTPRIRWKPPSPIYKTRAEAVRAQRKARITAFTHAPNAFGIIFRDGVDGLFPEGELTLINYLGTTSFSTRKIPDHQQRREILKLLGLRWNANQEPHPRDPERTAAKFHTVKDLVTVRGDLKAVPIDPQQALRPTVNRFTGRIEQSDGRRGCYGVTFWRAMDLKCQGCPLRQECDRVVDYRLEFGGREHFDRALANKEAAAKRYDVKAGGSSQGYQRMALDGDIVTLVSAYVALWYLSDLNTARRVRERRWLEEAPQRAAILAERAQLDERSTLAVRAAQKAFDDECVGALASCLNSGGLQTIATTLDEFFARHGSERQWRKRKGSAMELALVEISRQALEAAKRKTVPLRKIAKKTAVFRLAEIASGLIPNVHGPDAADDATCQLTYRSCDRHLATLIAIQETGWEIPALF